MVTKDLESRSGALDKDWNYPGPRCPCVGCEDSPEPVEGERCEEYWPCDRYIRWGEERTVYFKEKGV